MSWELEIIGDEKELRALGHSLRNEEYLIQEKEGRFVLCGPVFSKIQDPRAVREHWGKIVKYLSGLARLLLGSEKAIKPGAVFEIAENGGTNIYITPDPVTFRMQASMAVSAVVVSKDGKLSKNAVLPILCQH